MEYISAICDSFIKVKRVKRALVMIDKDLYIEKCMALLSDQEVYHECKDQTNSIHFKVYLNSSYN